MTKPKGDPEEWPVEQVDEKSIEQEQTGQQEQAEQQTPEVPMEEAPEELPHGDSTASQVGPNGENKAS